MHLLRWLLIATAIVTSPLWLPAAAALMVWTFRQHLEREDE